MAKGLVSKIAIMLVKVCISAAECIPDICGEQKRANYGNTKGNWYRRRGLVASGRYRQFS